MKVQVLILGVLGSLIALAAGKPAEGASMAQLLLRSCDHNADNALNAVEFAGCLMQTARARQQSTAAHGMAISRSEVLESLANKVDANNDLRADEAELQEPSQRWFLDDLFGGGESVTLSSSEMIDKTAIILQYISEEKYDDALPELYILLCASGLTVRAKASIIFVIAAIENEKYDEVLGFVYAMIGEIASGVDASGIFIVSETTATNIGLLLQAVMAGNSTEINLNIYASLIGIIVDFSFLSQESASVVAEIIQAVIENNSTSINIFLNMTIENISGISSETAAALTGLLAVVSSGQLDQISVQMTAVFMTLFEVESASEIVQIFVAVIQAVIGDNSGEAIRQLTVLYSKITISTVTASGFSSRTVVAFATIITALGNGDRDEAILAINLIISRSSSEFTSSQITTLNLIITAIQDGNYDEARSLIVTIATSGGSSGSSSVVEISVEVFVTLSSVFTLVEESGDFNAAIEVIETLMSNSSIKISVEIREALLVLITVLSEETSADALVVIAAIMTGSSEAYERTISVQVESEIQLIIAALDGDDLNTAISIIEALLRGENGGDSLSILVRNEFRQILIALEKNNSSKVFALLSIVSAGRRSSSLSVSVTVRLLVAINAVSSGAVSDAINGLKLLLEDDYLSDSFKAEIQIFISYLKENKSKAITAIVASVIGSGILISKSEVKIFYASLRLAAAGDSTEAIKQIEAYLEQYSASELRFVLLYVIQLLKQENFQGALTIINAIIVETFGDASYCD